MEGSQDGKIVGLFDHTAQNDFQSAHCELKMLPCQTACKVKGKKLAVSKASVLECFTWTLEVSHHLTNTKSTFEILSNKSSPVKCLTFQNRNKQKLNQNHVNCSHPKNFSNIFRRLF